MTRLERVREQMAKQNMDGFLVSQPENRRYLSGFTGSAGVLVITAEKQALATDSRYYEQVRLECPDWELIEVSNDFTRNMLEILRERGLGGRRVGFEARYISVAALHAWERALQGRLVLVHTEDFVEKLRIRKDDDELNRIKKAVAVADEALAYIITVLQPGITERQVAWELESYMRTHGASALSFELIVASGPNSAKPHAHPTDRPLQKGEPITLDLGCVVEGYSSDLTRTLCLGEPADDKYMTIWNIVYEAQQAAIQQAKAGMTGQAVDKIARDIIIQAGYGDYFGHSLGHGVGLAVHENPRFSSIYPDQVPAGAVMTIEPGIYIPGWGGVRLEDLVLVQAEGVEILTAASKQAIVYPV